MEALETAQKLASLGQIEDAKRAYMLVMNDEDSSPEAVFEATVYVFSYDGDYKICYSSFVRLYNKGFFQNEIFEILLQAFYVPNMDKVQKQYEKNVKRLASYDYIFRKDFPEFDDLLVKFFPYDDGGFIPFDTKTNSFRTYVNNADEPHTPRYFFKDLSKPILAENVYTEYEIGYLYDNVRRSEDVAMENHIYLHYDSFDEFCSYLCMINLGDFFVNRKLVFLFGEEIARYPINFLKEYDIDYDAMTPRPVRVNEVNRLIFHTQFSVHNGGDFFNEILDMHPNLLCYTSVMFDKLKTQTETIYKMIKSNTEFTLNISQANPPLQLHPCEYIKNSPLSAKNLTLKDCVVLFFLSLAKQTNQLSNQRIAPAILLQPHFGNIMYTVTEENGFAKQVCKEYEEIASYKGIKDFKYIRTFAPMRRFLAGFGGSIRFAEKTDILYQNVGVNAAVSFLPIRLFCRGYYVDPKDRFFKHSCIVRFEDGKLNPKATFTALAEFLDIPYTESMTICTEMGVANPRQFPTNVVGFDTSSVYNEYDDYLSEYDKYNLEILTYKDFANYGYKPHYYDYKEFTKDEIIQRLSTIEKSFEAQKRIISNWRSYNPDDKALEGKTEEEILTMEKDTYLRYIMLYRKNMESVITALLNNMPLITEDGLYMNLVPWLKPVEELLEQPLYE